MQAVKDTWYQLYRWGTAIVAAGVLLYLALLWTAPHVLPFGSHLHVSYFSAFSAAVQIFYAVVIYDYIAKRRSHLESMFVLAMVQAVTIFSLMESTGRMESPFVVWWLVASLLSGIFGLYGSGGTVFVTAVYFMLSTTNTEGSTEYTPLALGAFGLLVTMSLTGQLFWRTKYIDMSTEQVARLSGQLKTSQKQSEIIIQSLTDGVVLINSEGVITLMNPAAARMTGWSIEDGTGTNCTNVVMLKKEDGTDLTGEENPLSNVANRTATKTSTLQLGSHTKPLVVSLVVSPVNDAKTGATIGAVAVMRDISATYQSDKQRAEFVSTASHEMRTPVAAIEGYLQLALNEKVSMVDAKARSYLEKALDSTHHLGQLFQDLLTSAKAEDGRLVSHPTAIEMGEYLESLAETFRFSAEKKGLLSTFILGSGPGQASATGAKVVRPLYYVYADPDRLREVVTNIFDNAVKYTPQGSVSLGLTGNDDTVQLFVQDTGPGIPADDLPHLFQKFYRVDNSATRTIGGTGLGLFISRKIIEMYQGRIWAESTLGQGSRFYINLPRISTAKATEIKQLETQATNQNPINSLATPV